jgi:hypothetical protein
MGKLIKLPSELVEVEQYLDYYGVPYDTEKLEGKRIPLMLRFRFYLEAVELEGIVTGESSEEQIHFAVKSCLEKSYTDVGGRRTAATAGSAPAWAEGCITTSACASCKAACNS